MRRLHLIEIEDQNWCPKFIRDAATDYLQFMANTVKPYSSITKRIRQMFERTNSRRVIDLCSGGSGPWVGIQQSLAEEKFQVDICLTDKFPNLNAFEHTHTVSQGKIGFYPEPVDVLCVPRSLNGFRTMFSAFHHFKPEDARAIIRDAVNCRNGIGIFEVTQRKLPAILLIFLMPFIVLLVTPFIRPFRWSRLFWTYIIPAVPFIVTFDGIVSCLRTYTPSELREFVKEFSDKGYIWEIGEEKIEGSPIPITYLIGYPEE
jgi:hypothetical protein